MSLEIDKETLEPFKSNLVIFKSNTSKFKSKSKRLKTTAWPRLPKIELKLIDSSESSIASSKKTTQLKMSK